METYIVNEKLDQIFYHDKKEIRSKFSTEAYPMKVLNSVINDFERKQHDPMIPNYLFNDFESKSIAFIDVPLCNENKKVSKQLPKI